MSEQCKFEECHKILAESKANVLIVDHRLDARSNILMWIERTSYEEYKDYRNNGLNIGAEFLIEEVPVGIKLDGNTTKDDYEKLQTYISQGKVGAFSHDEAIKIISQVVPANVYDNWLSCMNRMIDYCKNQGYGLHQEITRNNDEIIVKVWYTPYNPNDSWPKISTDIYIPPSAKCAHDCLKNGDVINREVTMIFTRESGGNGTIAINTDKGSILVPLVPKIDESLELEIQNKIKAFVQAAFISKGAKLEEFTIPSNPKEHEPKHTFTKATFDINNFSATGTTLKCEVVVKRILISTFYTHIISKNLTTGEITEEWETSGHETPVEAKINIDLDYSKTDLENVIFCCPQHFLQLGEFSILEFCIHGKELAKNIIQWLE